MFLLIIIEKCQNMKAGQFCILTDTVQCHSDYCFVSRKLLLSVIIGMAEYHYNYYLVSIRVLLRVIESSVPVENTIEMTL